MSGKYALIIGNTEYTDPGLAQLTAPGKDAEDFARILKDKEIGAFDDVKVIVNEPSASVIEAIDEFFDQKKPDDMLVLYFSGHGIRDEIGSLYLAFKNTIRSRLRSTALKSDYIRDAMDQSRSKRQVLILDCCNSGAFPQGTKAELGGAMGMTKAFQGYGRFVLTASDATQFAWEGDKVIGETDNSLFTHFLVKGLEGEADSDGDGRITVDELYEYTYDQISRVTPKQTPTKSSSKVEGEIVLRQSTRIENIKPMPLPDELIDEIEDTRPYVREAAVQKLDKIIKGRNIGLARSAREALEKIIADENTTRRVAQSATQVLESIQQAEQLAIQKEADEQKLSEEEEAGRIALQESEAQRILRKRTVEAERQEKEKAERFVAQKAEEERIAKAKIDAEQLAEEKRYAREEANAEQKAKVLLAHGTAEKVLVTPGNIPGFPTKTRQQTILKWVLIGAIGLCFLGTGAWGISYLVGLITPAATERPVTEVPSNSPSVTTEEQATEQPVVTEPAFVQPPIETIACAGAQPGDELSILYYWSGQEEERLNQILQPLVDACGIVLNPESTSDKAGLDTRVQAGTPPNVAFWYVTSLQQYQGLLVPMDKLGANKNAYIPGAIDPGVIGGQWLGLPVKSDIATLIWYSPVNFEASGYSVPTTWDELSALVDQMVADGNVPWSMGLESGDATGWTGSHFIQDILLVQQGPEYVKGIIDGSIPYNDAGVMQAYETYGSWAKNPAYAVGGAEGTLSINFMDAIHMPFNNPPEAMMVRQLNFAGDEIRNQGLEPGTDYDFFVIPGAQGLQGNSDWMMAFSNKPAVQALVAYLSSSEGGANWAKADFGLSPNKAAAGNYTNSSLVKKAEAFYNTQGLTPTLDVSIPGEFPTVQWRALVGYLNGADLFGVLSEVAAAQAEALNR